MRTETIQFIDQFGASVAPLCANGTLHGRLFSALSSTQPRHRHLALEYKSATTKDLIDRLIADQTQLERVITIAEKYNLSEFGQCLLEMKGVQLVAAISFS